jgi:Putative peptidoglycan binding domain
VGALLIAAWAIAAIVLLSGGNGGGGKPATGVPPGYTTAAVTRRTLVESSTVDGTLGYGTTLELYNRLAGTFTWLPSVGATIARGGTLYRINDQPVVLMYGSVPAYRTLRGGVSAGPDVEQLNTNLIDLGYDPYGTITDDETFSAATGTAVRRFQDAEGLKETGEVQLGRVIFAPSARRVTAVHVTLGQDPPPSEETEPGGGGRAHAAAAESGSGKEGTSTGEKPTSSSPSSTPSTGSSKPSSGSSKTSSGASKPSSGSSKPSSGSSRPSGGKSGKPSSEGSSASDPGKSSEGGSGSSKPESEAAAAEAVFSTTSTQQLVQVKLKAEQQQLARVGERAPVQLPGGGTVQGVVFEVGTVASEGGKGGEGEKGGGGGGGENSESATIPVTLALTRHVPHLDEAPVSVELVKSVRRNVLAVPATALIAIAGGRYAIQVLEGGRRVELEVTPGMFANGYVQVEGPGLHEDQTVLQSE